MVDAREGRNLKIETGQTIEALRAEKCLAAQRHQVAAFDTMFQLEPGFVPHVLWQSQALPMTRQMLAQIVEHSICRPTNLMAPAVLSPSIGGQAPKAGQIAFGVQIG